MKRFYRAQFGAARVAAAAIAVIHSARFMARLKSRALPKQEKQSFFCNRSKPPLPKFTNGVILVSDGT
jgi:hypothetical protein